MDLEAYLGALEGDGALLVAAAGRAGLDAMVPACPRWQVRHLLRHLGYVHRWAAAHVAEASPTLLENLSEEEILKRGPSDGELLAWFSEGHAALVETLRSADPRMSCWTFLDAPSPLAFWARRQAHETAVHRADAEAAAGVSARFAPEFAADGIDELLVGFGPRERLGAVSDLFTLSFGCSDTAGEWLVTLGPTGLDARRGGGEADCAVTGPASDLYLVLWNRALAEEVRLSIRGERRALESWRGALKVAWA